MPLVSIIMNLRNGAATLREAIDSVLAQTFMEWNLIVWDDRSSDGSAGIVSQYHDMRIRYFLSAQDVSLGQARSDAMRQAQAEWIAFLDQDDVWLPGKLEEQMALAEEGVGLIYGRTVRFYPSGWERDYDHAHEYQLLPEGDLFTQLFTKSCFIAMSSAVFRRSAIEAIGGIPGNIRIIPDYYLYVAVARQYQVRAVQSAVCRYRMHDNNMSQVAALQMNQEVLWLIGHWAGNLDPQIVKRCRKRHQTAIALEEMRQLPTLGSGIVRLFAQGSVASQLSRPFTFAFHRLRRRFRRPYWRTLEG
jgi:glycosyltransferase involved in cell wall biosynthesis